ncbi:MAG: thermonuclease family protein [Bacteroidota bacterium]
MKMRSLILLAVMGLISSYLNAEELTGKVINVIDGNTLELETKADGVYKIKLSEVDCPEITQDFGEESKQYTESLILKKKVTIEIVGKDRKGTRLGKVVFGKGKVLNEELLKTGYAWYYNKSATNEQLTSLQDEAKAGKVGLWQSEDPTPPWIYRRKQTMMTAKSR